MAKRKQSFQNRLDKRSRTSFTTESGQTEPKKEEAQKEAAKSTNCVQISTRDVVEKRVDLIVKDDQANSYRSLTICGAGFGVEKTVAVVEELKRFYSEKGTYFCQETRIKAGKDNEPHLQITLTRKDSTAK